MRLIAKLSMPNVGSWNGKWSGEGDQYTIAFFVAPDKADKLLGSYYYNFGDGWGASVQIREPLKKGEKVTNKFCGYEWMVDEIKLHGRILTLNEREGRS